ncbi:hypothetical protein AAG570_008698 [Ranatra chinensis]|uniref:Uncharacterized protein n=1 Tax=Ranatra chinensis TaxID=642074 RepID=A0ABD0YRM4_9HEMI
MTRCWCSGGGGNAGAVTPEEILMVDDGREVPHIMENCSTESETGVKKKKTGREPDTNKSGAKQLGDCAAPEGRRAKYSLQKLAVDTSAEYLRLKAGRKKSERERPGLGRHPTQQVSTAQAQRPLRTHFIR